MEFMNVVYQRRSSRGFLPNPIPEEILAQILEAGRLAPSPGNGQNYIFGVVRDPVQKEALARAAGNQMWIVSAPIILALCAELEEEMTDLPEDDFGFIVNQLRFGEEFIAYMNHCPDRRAARKFWVNAAPLLPGEHMLLAATNFGLTGCWVGYLDTDRASELLRLPEHMVCLFLLPLGYVKEPPKAIVRKFLEEVVFYDQWE